MNDQATVQKNKDVYRKYIEEVFNRGKTELIPELLADNYIFHDAPPGAPNGSVSVKQTVEMFHKAFPDLKITLDEVIGEGDLVVARATTRGTHQGPLFGMQGTGKKVAMTGLTMVRVRDGKIQESWVRNDVMGLMAQIGAGPQISAKPTENKA